MDWMTVTVTDPVKAMLIRISGYMPVLLGALLIVVIGWLIAKILEIVVVKVLKIIKLDMASEKAGIAKVLAQGDVRISLSELLGVIVYWLVILITAVTALNAMNLTVAAELLSRLVAYIPNIIVAIFVLVLGSFLASLVGTVVRTAASNARLDNAKTLGKITQIILVIFAIAVAVEQLKIATELIAMVVYIILAAIGLSLALAFGLGCKDIAAKTMQDIINKLKK